MWTQIRLLLGAVCSGSTLFASILNPSVMLGNYLQQTTFSDAFFLGALRVNRNESNFSCRVLRWFLTTTRFVQILIDFFLYTNSKSPDQMPPSEAFDLGSHCFSMSQSKNARIIWVKQSAKSHQSACTRPWSLIQANCL